MKFMSILLFAVVACAVLVLWSSQASAVIPYLTERVNLTPSGGQSTGNVQADPTLSQDGRYAAFFTSSTDIVAGDTNGRPDVFVRNLKSGVAVRANLDSLGNQLDVATGDYELSGNGRFVVFSSRGSSIVPGDTNGYYDLFLRDLKANTTQIVSLTSTNGLLNNSVRSVDFDISADGRYVVFSTAATNVVTGSDTNNSDDVFIRDVKLGTTTLLSKNSAGSFGNSTSLRPSISCDGAYVTFQSLATNLVSEDTNATGDIFLIERLSNDSISNVTIGGNGSINISGYGDISCNGETIVFSSDASNLVSGDTNDTWDIFAYGMIDKVFQRVNLDSSGNQTGDAYHVVSNIVKNNIDFSGRYVVFSSHSPDLVLGDTNGQEDVFLRDLQDGTTQIVSKRNSTTQSTGISHRPSISLNGMDIIYVSSDGGLVTGDTGGYTDIFVSKTGI